MNKLSLSPPTYGVDARSTTSAQPDLISASWDTSHRFIILIPPGTNFTAVTRRIWELANATGRSVQLLGLCNDVTQESALYRELITMSALIRDARVWVEAKVEVGTNWVDIVKQNYQTGDMIVCLSEPRAGLLHRPLSQILQSHFNMPVYILSGLYVQKPSRPERLSQGMAWAGSVGIILASTFLQIRITSLSQDWFQTALLILSVIAEIWLIGIWNSLFG